MADTSQQQMSTPDNAGASAADTANSNERNKQFSQLVQSFKSLASGIQASLIGGTTGATDGVILVSKGTSGRALQPSGIAIGSLTSVASQRLLGRATAGTGAVEQLTFTQAMDIVGSAANGDILMRSAGIWTRLGIGSTADVLTVASGIPAWVAVAAAPTITPSAEVKTAGATITIPTNATKLLIMLVGGGGGGGGASPNGCACAPLGSCGGGGGGGGALMKYLTGLTPGNTVVLTVGAAGTAGASTPTNGGAGGNSTLVSGTQSITTLTANGGAGGAAVTIGGGSIGGAGGTATNGDSNHTGQHGGSAGGTTALSIGGSPGLGLGVGGVIGDATSAGTTGTAFGGGGSGGNARVAAANQAGGAGSAGGALLFWFQ